ncbi:YxeA family protein [Anaerocolumna aminovalerica]|uniref:YxeA family protein n=1 Tax=Anaerocolumna aminovalerica TaxID=1527 RepID=UPI00248CAA33|nr:YxeA family protein [Anaerocolumna aminovalerica]
MNTKTKLLVAGLIIIIFAAFFIFFFNPDRLTPENQKGKTSYYTMIVNGDTKLNHRKRYEYTLDAYNEKGEKKSLTFTSSKQLREGSYLELYVAPFRGVTYWQEVQPDELPDQVKSVYLK